MAITQLAEYGKSDINYDLVSWVLSNESYDQYQPIFIDPDNPKRSITAAEARSTIKKLIAGLKAAGLKKGDCVCVYAFNDVNYPLLFLAIVGAGGLYTGCNPSYTANEVSHHLQTTKARFLVADADLLAKVVESVLERGLPATKIFQMNNQDQDLLPDFCSYADLLRHGEAQWETCSTLEEAKTTVAALLSTSGTSGLPKAAMQSHHSFIRQSTMLEDNQHKPYEVSRLLALPIFHGFAFPLAMMLPLIQGVPTYIMRRLELAKFLQHVYDYEITETTIVPTIVTSILKSPLKAYKLLRPLRTVWCAGSTLPRLTQNDFFRILRPTARFIQTWGMTEAGWITTFRWPEKDHSGSVGRLLPGYEAKLVRQNRTITEDHQEAGIYIRGPPVMLGYLDNAEATAAALDKDGWLKTGDIGYKEQGKYYIVDREKELIKVRGWQISPAELEAQLNRHPGVTESAVIGVITTDGDTEVPRAYIVRSAGQDVTEMELQVYMAKYLAKYKSLTGGIKFVDAIPKNTTGKILRNVLRQVAAAQEATQQDLNFKVVPKDGKHQAAQTVPSTDSMLSAVEGSRDTRPPSLCTESVSCSGGDIDEQDEETVLLPCDREDVEVFDSGDKGDARKS